MATTDVMGPRKMTRDRAYAAPLGGGALQSARRARLRNNQVQDRALEADHGNMRKNHFRRSTRRGHRRGDGGAPLWRNGRDHFSQHGSARSICS